MATRNSGEIAARLAARGWAVAPTDPGEPVYGDPHMIDPITKLVYSLAWSDIIQANRDLLRGPSHDPAT